jgi:hypothetical protein
LEFFFSPPPAVLKAQVAEETFDPCATEAGLPSDCVSDPNERLCTNFEQWPCHEIFCLGEEDSIPPNFGIPPSGVISSINFEINGVYQITQNVTFNNCNFKMRPGASIVVAPTASNAAIIFNGCKFFSCNSMWQGITINASGASNLNFTFTDCQVEDAYIGLTLDEGKPYYYSIFNSKFINNHIGISNRKQTGGLGSMINAVMVGNLFTSTYDLAPIPASMQGLPMLFHPLAYAGVRYVRARTTVGPLSPNTGGTTNTFSCMIYGIVADNCTVTANNNDFLNLNEGFGRGIWVINGSMQVIGCHFKNAGLRCLYADGGDLTAKGNHYEGSSEVGILSENNLNGEYVIIENDNVFDISDDKWRSGIEIQRSTASTGVHNVIRDNTFNVSDDASLLYCIEALGFYGAATDEMHIEENHINVLGNAGTVNGVEVWFGNSTGTKIRGNVLNYSSTAPFGSFGFYFNSQSGMTSNNEVWNNIVTGTSNDALQCCFHSLNLEGTEFCDNTVNRSYRGFHFVSQNNVEFRENQMNQHVRGIEISGSDAQIGVQHGRGNTWSTDPNDCVEAAAQITSTGGIPPNPFNSEFRVAESNILPFLPPSNKIIPNPALQNWFFYDDLVPLDYCVEAFEGGPVKITPYESEATLSTSVLTGVPLWDLKRRTYAKLLLHPNLRPSSSAEETYFNSLDSSSIASFGQVEQMIVNSLSLSATDQQAFDNYRQAIFQSWEDLDALDAPIDFSDPNNLTGTYFADRAELLEDIAQNAESASTLESSRNQQTSQSLQNALTFNTNITSTQTYETARKTLNDIRIRHLLREPMTQTRYQQILALAQQDAETAGSATDEVVPYVAPCDRHQFKDKDESSERSDENVETHYETTPSLRLMPNPTNGTVQVVVPSTAAGTLKVFNASGQNILMTEVEQATYVANLNLTGFPPGIYLVVLCDVNGRNVNTAKISLTH